MAFGAKKFYKIYGLNNVFKVQIVNENAITKEFYDTSVSGFKNDLQYFGIKNIDEHTILFITANQADEGKYVKTISKNQTYNDYGELINEISSEYHTILKEGDTMIWSRGDLYSISKTQCVTAIDVDENYNIIIKNSDGSDKIISATDSKLGYTGSSPIKVDNSVISLNGIDYDSKDNFVVNKDNNSVFYGNANLSNTFVSGFKNTAYVNFQQVFGKYSYPDSKAIFVIGGGESNKNRYNVFTVDFDGTVYGKTDVVAGENKTNPKYKLSDIHDVLDEDWVFILGDFEAEDDFDESFDASYNDNVNDVYDYQGAFDNDFDNDFE